MCFDFIPYCLSKVAHKVMIRYSFEVFASIKISVNKNISVIRFYKYIRNIGKISMDTFTKISEKRKLYKIHINTSKFLKNK